MQSSDLAGRGFTTWRPFALATEKHLLGQLPTCFGVYSMRFPRAEPRLRGESDIAYIGKRRIAMGCGAASDSTFIQGGFSRQTSR